MPSDCFGADIKTYQAGDDCVSYVCGFCEQVCDIKVSDDAAKSRKEFEHRELVKQYAGQIFAGLCSNSLYDFKDADRMTESIVSKAHALATEVLASFKEKV